MITQYFIPEIFKHFHEDGMFFNSFLKPYTDVNAPAFFYSTQSITHIMLHHKGPAVMIINNDIRPIQNNIECIESDYIYLVNNLFLPIKYILAPLSPKPAPISQVELILSFLSTKNHFI